MASRKFLYAAIDAQGTAMAATGLCEEHFTTEAINENLRDPEAVRYVAIQENPEIACQVCGYMRSAEGWRCPGCLSVIEPSDVRRHASECDKYDGSEGY